MSSLKLYIFSFLFIFSVLAFSEEISDLKDKSPSNGKITGTLTFEDGTPAALVSVFIKSLNKYCTSGYEGEYELSGVPFGKYILEVKSFEIEPKQLTLEVDDVKTELSLTVKENKEYSLSEVVYMEKSEAQELQDKGFAVNMLNMEKAALQSVQANELLDRTAGVRIRQSGGMGSAVQYNINGLSGSSVRIFIDGIPIRNYGSSFSLSSIPPSQIERIEVYKGVVPTYLSEDALGGAINVVLKKSEKVENTLSTSYSYGSFNTHQWDMNGGYRDDKSEFVATGSAFFNYTDNDYKVWGDHVYYSEPPDWKLKYIKAKRFHDSYRSYGVNANFGFTDVSWADKLLLGILYSDMDKDVQNGGTMEVVYGNRRTGQTTKMANLRYTKTDLFVKGLEINTFISYSHSDRWVTDTVPYIYNWLGNKIWDEVNNDYYKWSAGGEQGKATLAENKEKTIAGRANVAYAINRNHKFSVNYLFNRFTRDVDDPLLPKAEQDLTETRYLTKQILGVAYENNFFDERLKTSLFFKHYVQDVKLKDPKTENNVLTYVEYDKSVDYNGYGLVASYELLPFLQLQVSYEKAVRMPESNELLGNTSESIDATYDLKPERSDNVNLGLNVGPFRYEQHQLCGNINFFVRDVKDMIMRGAENTRTGTYSYENLGKILSKGFDVELGYNYSNKLYLTFNLSLFNARYNLRYDKNGVEYSYYKDRLRNAPYFTLNNNIEYHLSDLFCKKSRTTFTYNFGYVHEFFRNWESIGGAGKAVIPAQYVHDLGVVYAFPKEKIALSLNIKNLFNEQVFDNWALQKPGRAIYAKINYKIF